jgi:hypothetical protein
MAGKIEAGVGKRGGKMLAKSGRVQTMHAEKLQAIFVRQTLRGRGEEFQELYQRPYRALVGGLNVNLQIK